MIIVVKPIPKNHHNFFLFLETLVMDICFRISNS